MDVGYAGGMPWHCSFKVFSSVAAISGRRCRRPFSLLIGTEKCLLGRGARYEATDGVEFVLAVTDREKRRRVLFSRMLNPFDEPADCGWQREPVTVELQPGEELVLETLPGPAGSLNRDWAGWGRLSIK